MAKEPVEKNQVEKINTTQYYHAVGRRKESTARVRLYLASVDKVKINDKEYEHGQIVVNEKPAADYFRGEVYKKLYLEPFRTTNNLDRFVTSVRVSGGGLHGQLEAMIHGIARALIAIDTTKYRQILKKQGFLTRDPRAKQRHKAGFAQKSRARKQSPKR